MGVISRALVRPETYAGWMREVAGTVAFVARYPFGVVEAGFAANRPTDVVHDTPVVLIHGYGHNRSGWFLIERHLRAAGFTNVATLNYNPLALDVPRIAARLSDRIEAIRHHSGAERVHVVGHSLGGIVLRWYVQELGGDRVVDTAITIASPHRGTVAAMVPFGRTASQLRPDSWVMRRLAATARPMPVRWLAYYTNLDVLVQPATSAMISHPALNATNVLVKDEGHLSVLLSPLVAKSIASAARGLRRGHPVPRKRRPGEQQSLLADAAEPHHRFGVVAGTVHLEYDALAPLTVDDVVAHPQPEPLGTRSGRRRPGRRSPEQVVDDGLTPG